MIPIIILLFLSTATYSMSSALTTISSNWQSVLIFQISHLIRDEKSAQKYAHYREKKHLLSRETVFILYCNAIRNYNGEAFNKEINILLKTPKFSYPNTPQNDTYLSNELALYGSILRGWNLVTAILDGHNITHPDRYDANVVKQWHYALTDHEPASATPVLINNSNQRTSSISCKSLIIRNKKISSEI